MGFKIIDDIHLNKIYSFSIKSTIFSKEFEEEIFAGWRQRATFATEYGEIIMTKVFSSLIRRPANDDHDFDCLISGNKDPIRIEMKCYGKNGCKLLPSNQLGVGREKDEILYRYRMSRCIYLICDVTNAPQLRVIFYKGGDLFGLYPNGSITIKDKASLFHNDADPLEISKVFSCYRAFTETENEEYYTKKSVVKKCLDFFGIDRLSTYDVVIEPSAGDGAFSSILGKLSINTISYDINPKAESIIKQDFLTLDVSSFGTKTKVLTIGNPPFGRQSSMAKKFIKKVKEYSSTIAFILPRSFKKDSMKKVFGVEFLLEREFDIESKAFLIRGEIEHDVPCIFQIWNRIINPHPLKEKISKAKGYKFIPKSHLTISFDDKNKIFIHRAGSKAGLCFSDKSKLINDSGNIKDGYYIIESDSLNSKNKQIFIDKINKIEWAHNNTIGQRSISQSEIIPYLNEIFL